MRAAGGASRAAARRACPARRPRAAGHARCARAPPRAALGALPHALGSLPLLVDLAELGMPAVCFDAECQQRADAASAWSVLLPGAAAFYALSRVWAGKREPEEIIDELVAEDKLAEDRRGDIIYTPMSYTPWPIAKDADMDSYVTLRVPVGDVRNPRAQPFAFPHTLGERSQVFAVSLPRPLGISFEDRRGRCEVVELTPGGAAEQAAKVARLQGGPEAEVVQVGDVLRGCTATTFVYKNAYAQGFGEAPRRTLTMYGADGEEFANCINALRRGLVADGEVTLVLERRRQRGEQAAAAAGAVAGSNAAAAGDEAQ